MHVMIKERERERERQGVLITPRMGVLGVIITPHERERGRAGTYRLKVHELVEGLHEERALPLHVPVDDVHFAVGRLDDAEVGLQQQDALHLPDDCLPDLGHVEARLLDEHHVPIAPLQVIGLVRIHVHAVEQILGAVGAEALQVVHVVQVHLYLCKVSKWRMSGGWLVGRRRKMMVRLMSYMW
jgi:hypothetical protein